MLHAMVRILQNLLTIIISQEPFFSISRSLQLCDVSHKDLTGRDDQDLDRKTARIRDYRVQAVPYVLVTNDLLLRTYRLTFSFLKRSQDGV